MIDALFYEELELPQLFHQPSNERIVEAPQIQEEFPFNDDLFEIPVPKHKLPTVKVRQFAYLPFYGYFPEVKECPICMSASEENDKLSCGDSYCSVCIKLLLKDCLDNGRVLEGELKCPLCEVAIADSNVKDFLGEYQYDRLLRLRQSVKTDKLVADGKAKHCPLPACGGYIHIINGAVAPACAVCRASVCGECFKASHPTLTCEEYKQAIGDTEDDVEELMLSQRWKRCPFCSSIVEKLDGCQFVKCESKVCCSYDRALCYLCGKGLNEKHHFSHFQTSGPFSKTCNTLDGIEDEPLNVPNQEAEEEEEE